MPNTSSALVRGPDGRTRCAWCEPHPDYRSYHDEEWGRPVVDDQRLFEKLCLEGFQSGLSWLTILRKRDAFRRAFSDFDFRRVARMDGRDLRRLMRDAGLVRHRGKLEATLANARAAVALCERPGDLARLLWSFAPETPLASPRTRAELARRSRSPESEALAKELRRRGFRYVGPTTCYAFMQSMGFVNDHLMGCGFRARAEAEQRQLRARHRRA